MTRRTSGILLHISSLPGKYGIGDMGPEAFNFADFLASSGQNLWQVLPLNPTALEHGNSPYHSCSAFAGNPLLISPQVLLDQGRLNQKDIVPPPFRDTSKVDFGNVIKYKKQLLEKTYQRFVADGGREDAFERFCRSTPWLHDYALYEALRSQYKTGSWHKWPTPLRNRRSQALTAIAKKLSASIQQIKFRQFLFFQQWHALKSYCRDLDIRIIGDIPIYLPLESADVWCNTGLFKMDRRKRPIAVSGVPPDYFSRKGQLWGHPVYRWDRLKETHYQWWINRFSHNFDLFDMVRIDHFRGLVAFWEVPAQDRTAVNGKWRPVPYSDFFHRLSKHFGQLPVIAEDLGLITPDVREAMRKLGVPGMRVLQFAFGNDFPASDFLPHRFNNHCVAYTGTHDNNTTAGWYDEEIDPTARKNIAAYIGRTATLKNIHWEIIRLVMLSVADTVIIPCQDILGLDATARMNHPARIEDNWRWRLSAVALTPRLARRLHELTRASERL